jgi:hypothetical protein
MMANIIKPTIVARLSKRFRNDHDTLFGQPSLPAHFLEDTNSRARWYWRVVALRLPRDFALAHAQEGIVYEATPHLVFFADW